ncbi:MAG: phosphotransferase family protein [Pseudomonadota bacterium]
MMNLQHQVLSYLEARIPGATDMKITRFENTPAGRGGSRNCFIFTAEWKEANEAKTGHYVLRQDPEASLLESDRETEFRILKALEKTDVAVPKVYWLERGPSLLGRPFIIMEHLTGDVTSFFNLVGGDNASLRAERAKETVVLLSRLHTLDWRKQGLDFLGVPAGAGEFAAAQIDYWESFFNKFKLETQLVLREAFLWMHDHIPKAGQLSLVHGDFKTDNIMYDGSRIKGLLDWELSAIGDPLADLAWMSMGFWKVGDLCSGLISKKDLISEWERLTGYVADEQSLLFWEVLSNVKLAVIHIIGAHSFATRTSCAVTKSLATGALSAFFNMRILKNICELLKF